MRGERGKVMLQEFYEIKRMFELPLKLRLYFSTLEDLLEKKPHSDLIKQQIVDPLLLRVFLGHSDDEKTAYLLHTIRGLKEYYERGDEYGLASERSCLQIRPSVNHIETSCQLQSSSFRLTHWVSAKFKFDKLRQTVSVSNKKRNMPLHLQHYLVRHSRKHKHTLVLEATSREVSEEYTRVSLCFQEQVFMKVYQELFDCVVDIHRQDLVRMARGQQQQGETERGECDKSLVFLSSEQITFYLKYKSHIVQRLQVGGFSFKNIYEKNNTDEAIRIDRSLKIDKIFKLEFEVKMPLLELKQRFLASMQGHYKYRLNSTVLEEFSRKYRAVYDRYLISNKIYEQISIKEESLSDKEEVFFSKGVENIMTGNYLEFILVKAKPTDRTAVNRLVLVASLILGKDINLEIAIAFLLEFRDMLFRTEPEHPKADPEQEQDFFTIVSGNEMEEQLYEIEESDEASPEGKYNAELDLKKQKSLGQQLHLKSQQRQVPQELSEQQLKSKILTEHFLFKEWQRCKHGGVVCINEAMLVEQKKMIKKIMANIGSNLTKIVKSGSVLNISLPVSIFKKESHLQSIAMNFSYAPLLFDRFHTHQDRDSYERFKYAVLYTISVSNLGISSEKPFNPILGETLQCWVGGCPLYLEQISHHPPIASYYFVGRGYKIYGQIDPKIGIGLNSGKCWSEKPNFIDFEDGTRICLIYSKMVIKGLIFGDREFHFEDKVYVYDMKNHYFAEIFFGPRKRSLVGKSDPEDYIHGKIYRTTSAYLAKFREKNPPLFPGKDDISKARASIEGIWNQAVSFDDKEYINFATELPYRLEYEEKPLPSNSTFRKDLNLYIEGDIEKAQEQKEVMEQMQRRDRKLREGRKGG